LALKTTSDARFLQQGKDETPRWHKTMKVVELPSVMHAKLAASELPVTNLRPL